ncbi:hypothetical protein RJ55_07323 [Drechmeria coniospora]|nr:hypothetical protein RJ55_07323 [Drechmeria coniospora]
MHLSHLRPALLVPAVFLWVPAATAEMQAKLQWQFGRNNCNKVDGPCAGTDVYCGAFFAREYSSQDDCFNAYEERPANVTLDWESVKIDCQHLGDTLPESEPCAGTEGVCGRIENRSIRMACFESREKGPYLRQQNYPPCPDQVAIYGSMPDCFARREKEANGVEGRTPWFFPLAADKCNGDVTEVCVGTVEYCDKVAKGAAAKNLNKEDRNAFLELARENKASDSAPEAATVALQHYYNETVKCLARREKRPFSIVYSPRCRGAMSTEDCMGSHAFCKLPTSIKLYGSEAECLKLRQYPPRQIFEWRLPRADCRSASEWCRGTLRVCMKDVPRPLRKACLASRLAAPWYFRKPDGATRGKGDEVKATEESKGSAEWCFHHFGSDNYASTWDCLEAHGLPAQAMGEKLFDLAAEGVKNVLLDVGKNVTAQTVIRQIFEKNATAEETVPVINQNLHSFLDETRPRINSTLIRAAIERGLGRLADSPAS